MDGLHSEEPVFNQMTEKSCDKNKIRDDLERILKRMPWFDIVLDVLQLGKKLLKRSQEKGMYEVLEYESTLELKDQQGSRATFKKREKIRYLQDNVIAYQDQAWGDGEILRNYQCTPGKPVDFYRSGYKTHVLISRREVKNRGDVDEFNIEWGIRDGFQRETEQWETHVVHLTKKMEVSVVFPKNRPPIRALLIERNRQLTRPIGNREPVLLPDGRTRITWESTKPKPYETYIIQWVW